jgi:hypothetical protein
MYKIAVKCLCCNNSKGHMAMSAVMTLSEIVRPSPAEKTALTSCHNYPSTSSSSAPDSGDDMTSIR